LEVDITATCGRVSEGLRSGTYQFTQYLEQLKSKGAGKAPRVISIPTARDRITLRALAECMIRVYPEAGGVIPQVRVHEITKLLGGDHPFDSFIRLDVKSFYPSIRHDRVLEALAQRVRKREFIDVVQKAIQTPTVPAQAPKAGVNSCGVPQGLAISNVLSELIAHQVDLRLRNESACAYFRFVDDILILCSQPDAESLYSATLAALSEVGLEAYPLGELHGKSRTGLLTETFDYLGYQFEGSSVSVRKDRIAAIESRLAREFTRYRKGAIKAGRTEAQQIFVNRVDLAITGCVWNNSARGWLAYYKQVNDQTMLKGIDFTVERLRSRFSISKDVHFKTFMRAHWAIKHPHGKDSTYIPNHDNLTVNQMRERLSDFMPHDEVEQLHDRVIPRTFERLMNRLTTDLERDIGDLS